jgi:glyoxylase I family protein
MGVKVEGLVPLIQVFDMPASLRFYRDVLGFEIVAQSSPGDDFDWGWLRLDGADLMLNTAYEKEHRPAKPDTSRIAGHDDTCLYFGCRDVDAAYEYLRSRGVTLGAPKVAPYGMKQIFFKDPDGYQICFQWREEARP